MMPKRRRRAERVDDSRTKDQRKQSDHHGEERTNGFICGGAFVGLDEIMSQTHGFGFIATSDDESQNILDRLNTRVKPTDLFAFGLISEFTGRLPIIARFQDLTKEMLVRIMTEPKNFLYSQFQEIFRSENVALTVHSKVFEQVSELAIEYKTGARSLGGYSRNC